MKTTLIISDNIMPQIKALAAKNRQTLSKTVEALLRSGLENRNMPFKKPSPLPEYEMGRCLVDISDRDRLYQVMERK